MKLKPRNGMIAKVPGVAPARERGLKHHIIANFNTTGLGVAPARERGLKHQDYNWQKEQKLCRSREGAWIETALIGSYGMSGSGVAPARERGLKLTKYRAIISFYCVSLPRGSVD